MYKVSKILVPVDFSECSFAALGHGQSLAEQLGAKVEVLHVAEVPAFKNEPRLAEGAGSSTLSEYAVAAGQAELDAFLGKLEPAQRARLKALVEPGRPRDRILERASREHCDLIVMGTHGRTGRAHSLAGSVTESVVRSASCPVLTVRVSG